MITQKRGEKKANQARGAGHYTLFSMADYASQTVAQLKEVLKGKGLSTDGKKADLVQRLVDADGAEEPAGDAAEPAAEPAASGEAVEEAAPVAPVAPEDATAPEAAAVPLASEPASGTPDAANGAGAVPTEATPKVLTADERKQLAVDLLQKKIARAQKFGDDDGAQAAKRDLARVEKFGVELGTALASEIGLGDRVLGNGVQKRKTKRRNRH